MTLVEAFRAYAYLVEVPDPADDPEGFARADRINAVREHAASVIFGELSRLGRQRHFARERLIDDGVQAAARKLLRREPRGTRATDPSSDDAVRRYLAVVLANAVKDVAQQLHANDSVQSGDIPDDTIPSTSGFETEAEVDEDPCAAIGQRVLTEAILPGMSPTRRQCISECAERAAVVLQLSRLPEGQDPQDTLRALWRIQLLNHANSAEAGLLAQVFATAAWNSAWSSKGQWFARPPNVRTFKSSALTTVVNRMAMAHRRALLELVERATKWIALPHHEVPPEDLDLHGQAVARPNCIRDAIMLTVPGLRKRQYHAAWTRSRQTRMTGEL